ncbi:proline-rich transmembrane protein 4-like [Dendronephthya gigantea]|uniref:proline-rich transmembrane protein 4-like n=1 Tax=Dendronephthya gigantea TaxID=151771 RepID=UPI00106ACEDB|nr:proline-rich transmembrane protein 4-like [Dendronephthya gigantea]XP_028391667.1 proline-rich transmembrane protein 4-like [Dendronephthya gigantea]XP_028391668.1 proline-rich transmembrane protein 4-like [Dendronephthya gigantea]XP_028391669.1 proline-rich transmembrane protein 4-like [Dendronephthya gigantea]
MVAEPSWPEPGPNWPEAKSSWGLAWPIHVYAFASIWTLAAIYFLFFFVQSIWRRSNEHKRSPLIMLSLQLLIQALSRCFVLFLNPYASRSSNHAQLVITIAVWSLGTAGLTSAFGVLLLILLDATKLSLAPPKFQNIYVLIIITIANFAFVVVSDIIVAFHESANILLVLCQVTFALWGVVITVGYSMAAYRIRKNLTATFDGVESGPKTPGDPMRFKWLIIKCCVSSILGLCVFGMSLYAALFGESSVLSDTEFADSWPWWVFQTIFRILEILVTLLISVVALQTPRVPR